MSLLLFLFSILTQAQTDSIPAHRITRHSTMFGAGWANTYDTYLSPLEYSGAAIAFMHETERQTHWPRITTQGTWRLHATSTQNPTGNRDAYGARLGYQHVWLYTPTPAQKLKKPNTQKLKNSKTQKLKNPKTQKLKNSKTQKLKDPKTKKLTYHIGGGIAGDFGGLYNTHAGNNPAQAYATLSLVASAAADYTFQWPWWSKRQPFNLRAQLDAPFLGLMFAPRYGQSYYNIFAQGNYDRNIVCTTPFNAPTLRGRLMLDIPVGRHTLRIGYAFDALQAKPNHLRQHTYLHNIMIGWTKQFYILH